MAEESTGEGREPTAESGAGLIDVAQEGHLGSGAGFILAAVAAGVIVAVVLVAARGVPLFGQNQTLAGFVLFAAGFGAAAVAIRVATRFKRGRLRGALEERQGENLAGRVEKVLPHLRGLHAGKLLGELARSLVSQGAAGSTVRIGPAKQASEIVPITVEFEPRSFDRLADLDAAAEAEDGIGRRAGLPRGVVRNVLLKGGWVLVAIFGFNWIMSAIEAYGRKRVTTNLMISSVALAAVLLLPVGSGWLLSDKQWWAVPGGLVFRKGAKRGRGWDVHLFRPAESVLVMARTARHGWALVVADRERCESAFGVRGELEYALGAWLSPLEPPSEERLSDLG
jgi:hypothetical protein